jgi:hypothetical protein
MIFHDGFACRRFDITAEDRSGRVEMAGNVIIGLPRRAISGVRAGAYPRRPATNSSPDSNAKGPMGT